MIETIEKVAPKVGDIVVAQWGYEASYPEWYRIEKISGEYATLQELEKVYLGAGSIYDSRLLTTYGKSAGTKSFRRKIKAGQYGYYIRINSYKYAQAWDGRPCDEYNHH